MEINIIRMHIEAVLIDQKRHAEILDVSRMTESERLVGGYMVDFTSNSNDAQQFLKEILGTTRLALFFLIHDS